MCIYTHTSTREGKLEHTCMLHAGHQNTRSVYCHVEMALCSFTLFREEKTKWSACVHRSMRPLPGPALSPLLRKRHTNVIHHPTELDLLCLRFSNFAKGRTCMLTPACEFCSCRW